MQRAGLGHAGAVQVACGWAACDVLKLPVFVVTATSKVWKRPPLSLRRWIAIFWRRWQVAWLALAFRLPLSRSADRRLSLRLLGTSDSRRRMRAPDRVARWRLAAHRRSAGSG